MNARSLSCGLAVLLLGAAFSRAERSGNFEIAVQPFTTESKEVVDRSAWHTASEKTQTMVYKVRIDLKGTEKVQDLVAEYVVAYRLPSSHMNEDGTHGGVRYRTGSASIPELGPHDKFEFATEGVENVYQEYQGVGYRSQWGKLQLKGIAVRVVKDGAPLAQIANPPDMKDAWAQAERQKKEMEERMRSSPSGRGGRRSGTPENRGY
jgi:hypothetical protein